MFFGCRNMSEGENIHVATSALDSIAFAARVATTNIPNTNSQIATFITITLPLPSIKATPQIPFKVSLQSTPNCSANATSVMFSAMAVCGIRAYFQGFPPYDIEYSEAWLHQRTAASFLAITSSSVI